MSTLSIIPYFPFDRVRIANQEVFSDAKISQINSKGLITKSKLSKEKRMDFTTYGTSP